MVCEVCKTRNPAGFCAACQKMLCDECSKLCEQCGKMVCPECVVTTRSGKVLCPACLEELKAKRAQAKAAGAPPEEAQAAEEAFPVPEVPPRALPRPWVASLVVGCAGVLLSLLLHAMVGPVHFSVFIVAMLGLLWGMVGLFGPYEQKAHALAGIALNIVPFVLVFMFGLEAPWIKREEDTAQQQLEKMTEQQKAEMRIQKSRALIQQMKRGR